MTGPEAVDRAQLLTVRPGDRVLIVMPADTSPEHLEEVAEALRGRFPDVAWTFLAGVTHVVHEPGATEAASHG